MSAQPTLPLTEPPRCHHCHTPMPAGVLIGPTGGTWRCENTHLWEPRRTEHAFVCPTCDAEERA